MSLAGNTNQAFWTAHSVTDTLAKVDVYVCVANLLDNVVINCNKELHCLIFSFKTQTTELQFAFEGVFISSFFFFFLIIYFVHVHP